MNNPPLTKKEKDQLTYTIIGCAMEVHNHLGNGFQEVIYQRCLSIELYENKVEHQRELEIPILYKEQNVGSRRADFLICDEILVEIKALIKLENVHLAQALNYLEAYHLETGLLINFGAKSLEYKRLYNKRLNQDELD